MVQPMISAVGLAWPPCAASPEVADALVAAACDWLRGRGVKVCQSFATNGEQWKMLPLERNGFQRVTQLVSLRRDHLSTTAVKRALAFAPESPPFTNDFRAATLATHEGTLDCPELNGARTDQELLAGFTEPLPGVAWFLARQGESPVGVVMLTAGAEPSEIELAYLGVVPAARGRGLGRELMAFALSEAAQRGASSVIVSVDSRNELALRLYQRGGFIETDRREVWLAHLS